MLQTGKLLLVGTPIGNIEDMTFRAKSTLATAKIILCEDTRVTARLLDLLDIQAKAKLYRVDEYTEMKMVVSVVAWLDQGIDVCLVTDAGMPAVSDPGYKLVAAIRTAGYGITVVPGVSALTAAMSLSGLNTSKTLFVGFLAKSSRGRAKNINQVKQALDLGLATAVVIYESPERMKALMQELNNYQLVSMGELTKLHEKILVNSSLDNYKGEWVVIVGKR